MAGRGGRLCNELAEERDEHVDRGAFGLGYADAG
jgi:hypothetical protein